MSDDWKPGDLLSYVPETGELMWRERPGRTRWNARYAGLRARLKIDHQGYALVKLFGRYARAHRVAWEIVNGPIPDGLVIDHINGDRADNRLCNLRLVTQQDNLRNARLHRGNKSGTTGVRPSGSKWQAEIWNGTRRVHLGTFATKEAAIAARKAAEVELGFHENHGRPLSDQEREDAFRELSPPLKVEA